MTRAEELAEKARPCSVCAPRVEPALSELVADAEALAEALEQIEQARRGQGIPDRDMVVGMKQVAHKALARYRGEK